MSDRKPSTVKSDGEKFVCSECHWSSPVNDYTHDCLPFLKSELEAAISRAESAEADAKLQHEHRAKETESFGRLYLENKELKAQLSEANDGIVDLNSQVDAANERADEWEMKHREADRERLEFWHKLVDSEKKLTKANREIERLAKELQNSIRIDYLTEANNQLAELKEQLRWRKYPEEKPNENCRFIPVKRQLYQGYEDDIVSWNGDGDDDENWSELDVAYWFSVSELVESPPTGGEG